MIDYICGLTDTDIATSQEYIISYIDPADGTIKEQVVTAGD